MYIYIHAPLYLMISYETQYIASMPEGWFTVSLFSFPPRVGCSRTSSRNGASGPEKSSNFPANQGSQWWNRRAEDLQSQAWIVQDWKERVGEVSEMLRNMTNRNDFCRNQSIQGKTCTEVGCVYNEFLMRAGGCPHDPSGRMRPQPIGYSKEISLRTLFWQMACWT